MKETKRILIVLLLLAVVVAGTLLIESQFKQAFEEGASTAEIVYRVAPEAKWALLYMGYEKESFSYPTITATKR